MSQYAKVTKEKFDKDMEYIMKDCAYWLDRANFSSTAQVLYYVLSKRAFAMANPKDKPKSNNQELPF